MFILHFLSNCKQIQGKPPMQQTQKEEPLIHTIDSSQLDPVHQIDQKTLLGNSHGSHLSTVTLPNHAAWSSLTSTHLLHSPPTHFHKHHACNY